MPDQAAVARPSLKAAVAVAAIVACSIGILAYFFQGRNLPTIEIPWFIPTMNAFLCLVSTCVAFLAFGRFAVLRDSTSFWITIGSVGFAVGMLFNILTFPGLFPGQKPLMGSVSNTAVWMGSSALWLLAFALVLAGFSPWPTERAWVAGRWRLVVNCWVVAAIVLHFLFVRYETHLPLLIDATGFTSLFRIVTGLLVVIVSSIGAIALSLKYSRTGDALCAYVALCNIAMAGVGILSGIIVTRYDLWWYVQRTLWAAGFLAMLFGLLSEYLVLFRGERDKSRQLEASETKFRSVFENTAIGVALVSFDDARWMDVNESFCRMLGYTREEMLGIPWPEMTHPEDIDLDLVPFRRMASGEIERYTVEKRFIHKKGKHLWARLTLSLVRDSIGNPDHEIAVIEDIQERKLAEALLRESEEKYRSLFENSPDAIFVTLSDGTILSANPAATIMFGMVEEELRWRGREGIVVEDSRLKSFLKERIRSGRARGVLGYRRKDGSLFEAEAVSVMLQPGDRGFVILRDVSDRIRAENTLRESEERFRGVFENAAVGIGLFDQDLAAHRANAKLCDILGYSEQDLIGRSFRGFIHPDDLEPDLSNYAKLMEGGLQSYTVEKRYIRKGGDSTWVRVTRSAQPGWRGVPQYSIGVIEDISRRKEAEESRERLLGEVQRSNQDLQQFAYVASHDLQEPLRMVSSYMQMLERKYREQLDEKARKYIHYAVDGTRRMQDLIDGLLRYSRISGETRLAPVDTNVTYAEALLNLTEAIGDAGAQVTADHLPTVPGDGTLLVQLFQNLIGNGLKYRKPGVAPEVHVSARREGGEWVFSVRDNGIGIDPQHFDRVFQIFQRLHTSEEYPGTGIGLASCKKIVERHGGRIWIESAPGEGSTFHFSLPAEQRS